MLNARLTDLDYNEILAFLGTEKKNLSDDWKNQIEECKEKVSEICEPKLVYKRVSIKDKKIEGLDLSGNDIWRILENSDEAVVFGATVGIKIDQLISKLQVLDMAKAVISDACAGAAIENVCNNFEADLRLEIEKTGLYLTERFSPGYGDLKLEMQKQLAELLNCQRRIGLVVSENFMMTPVKSVTAIMGISKVKTECRIHKCDTCTSRETCRMRAARLVNE